MQSVYDSRTPAQGVRVLPTPRPRPQSLTLAQQSGLRLKPQPDGVRCVWGQGVFRPVPECRPVKTGGGGLPPDVVVRKGSQAKPLSGRIGACLERGLPRTGKAPVNTICRRPIPTQTEYRRREAEGMLRELRQMYVRIKRNGTRVDARLDERYEVRRAKFLRMHGCEHGKKLVAQERQLDATVR